MTGQTLGSSADQDVGNQITTTRHQDISHNQDTRHQDVSHIQDTRHHDDEDTLHQMEDRESSVFAMARGGEEKTAKLDCKKTTHFISKP